MTNVRTKGGQTMEFKMKVLWFCCLFVIVGVDATLNKKSSLASNGNPSVDINYKTLYFEQQVDHFSFANQDLYQMRYLVNDEYWDNNGGPIFFYCGNEGDIEWFCNNTGIMWEWAPEFKAMIVFAEHRYYGKSLPYGKNDKDHMGYLTSQQALADFATLLLHMKATVEGAANSPIIAFGGSYGGMLATWFRMKYPYVVQGSLAASAPIWMFGNLTPCDSFYKTVTADFTKSGPNCAENIKKSWKVMDSFGSTDSGRAFLSSTFHLCSPLTSQDDVGELKGWLYNMYGNLAMVDYPYAASFLEPLPAWPIKVYCSHLSDPSPSNETLMSQLATATRLYYNYTGESKCLNITTPETKDLGDEGWDYQACSEMFMPQCSTGVDDMFESMPFNYTEYAEGCKRKWGVTPRPDWAITEYGGKDITDVTNIIFSNGGLDPWSGGGVLKDLSDSLVSIFIPEGAHHLDLRASNPQDPDSVVKAREQEKTIIRRWIKEYSCQTYMEYVMETMDVVGGGVRIFNDGPVWIKRTAFTLAGACFLISAITLCVLLRSNKRSRVVRITNPMVVSEIEDKLPGKIGNNLHVALTEEEKPLL